MTDIIIIEHSSFVEFKNNISEDDNAVKLKYEGLYKKYNCFSISPPTPYTHNITFKKNYPNKKNNNHHEKVYFQPKHKDKDLNKIIRGILNIINKSNYTRMLNRIRLIKTEKNILIITQEILSTSAFQGCYLHIFMKLLSDLVNFCSESEKTIVELTVNEYIDTYMLEKKWLNNLITKEYNDFCNTKKFKTMVIAQNKTIIELANIFHINYNIHKHSENLLDDLKKALQKNDDDNSIVIAQMIMQIPLDKIESNININIYIDLCKSKRVQFVIEDLCKVLIQKRLA